MYRYLLALFCLVLASANAARLGDKGKGWKVKKNKYNMLYCEYNGKFRLAPEPSLSSCKAKGAVIGFSDPAQGCPKYHPVTIKSSSDVRQAPNSATFRIKSLGRGRDGEPKGYNIIAENGCVAKYLEVSEDPTKGGSVAELELTNSKKWTWQLKALDSDSNSIDCLKNIDVISQEYRTSIATNRDCSELVYDGDESYWSLIPV